MIQLTILHHYLLIVWPKQLCVESAQSCNSWFKQTFIDNISGLLLTGYPYSLVYPQIASYFIIVAVGALPKLRCWLV